MRVHHLLDHLQIKDVRKNYKLHQAYFSGNMPNARLSVSVENAIEYGVIAKSTIDDADNAIEMIKREYLGIPQFDVGRIYDHLPDKTAEELGEYTHQLFKAGLFKLPYNDFIVSFYYVCENLMRVKYIEETDKYEFHIWQYNPEAFVPTFCIAHVTLSSAKDDKREGAAMNMNAYNMFFIHHWAKIDKQIKSLEPEAERLATNFCGFLFVFLGLLQSEGIVIEKQEAPKTLNRIRKSKNKAPIGEIHEIRLVVGGKRYNVDGRETNGSHSTKRLHWRRGHIRRLANGVITNVRPCLVGDISKGDASTPVYKIVNTAVNQ